MAKIKAKTSKAAPVAPEKDPPPSWPPFKPSLPVLPLSPVTHSDTSKIVLLNNFFPRSLCRDYVAFFKTLPLQTTPGKPKRGEAVRVNDRYQVDDAAFAERLWEMTGLRDAIMEDESLKELWGGEPVGLSPNIRVYRYSKGQYFDCHYDDSNNLTLPKDPPVSVRTTWTLLLYLTSRSDGCEGGQTVFYTHDRKTPREAIVVPPETGLLLLHKHGDDCLLHEGQEVTAGEKWILRTDLCVSR
ncbi:2OG-Fe(II) oxygenase superfamily protein [Sarocladium implicatum]|nr:2OG-Fe(II) oxygenase superfamily protein [Sarocladium implicatum]